MQDKISSLDLLEIDNSGFDYLLQESNNDRNYMNYLSKLILGKKQELANEFSEHPERIATAEIKAIYLLNTLLMTKELKQRDFYISRYREKTCDEYAYQLTSLYAMLAEYVQEFNELKGFQVSDLLSLREFLPSIIIYYADYVFSQKLSNRYHELYQILSDDQEWSLLEDSNLLAQKYRLLAFYYRLQGNMETAEASLCQYRESFIPNSKAKLKLVCYANRQGYLAKDIYAHWEEILIESKELQEEVILQTGLNNSTCFYFKCTDCCTKSPPAVSYTEYSFLHEYLETIDPQDLVKYKNKASAIQEEYAKTHSGAELEIVDVSQNSMRAVNPTEYPYACPFLADDGACGVYEVRPYACRVFALSTINGKDIQSCRYFLAQHQANANQRNERHVYDARPVVALIKESDEYLTEQQFSKKQHLQGTLVAWLTKLRLFTSVD